MSQDKIKPIEDKGVAERAPFNDTIKQDERYSEYYSLFIEYEEHRNQTVRFLNKNGQSRNIIDYVQDGVDRMNEFRIKPSHKDPWQNNTFDPITRNKVIAVLSKLLSARIKAEVQVLGDNILADIDADKRADIYQDLLEHANDHNREDLQLVWEAFVGLSQGSVVGYEGWKRDARTVEIVVEFDPDTGEKKTKSYSYDKWDDVYGEIVPINEWYPENIWMNIKDWYTSPKRCFRAREMKFSQFRDVFGGYPGAGGVLPHSHSLEVEDLPWGVRSDVDPENVFVLEWFDDASDKYGVWANGKELYFGPLPWNHKNVPFWLSIAEPIHNQYLYGKSMPDKMMSMQDTKDGVLNAVLDQLLIGLKSPIFVDGDIDLDEDYLEPGRIIELSPGSKVTRGDLGNLPQTSFAVLQLLSRSLEESSISSQAQGIATGGRKTKYEVSTLEENAMSLAGMFLQLFEYTITEKYKLRLSNILQYYSMPSRTKSGRKKFKFIKRNNRKLTNGKMGTRLIQIVGDKSEVPSANDLKMLSQKITGDIFNPLESRIEPIVISIGALATEDYLLDIKIVPNSSIKESETSKKNKDIMFYNAANNDPKYNQEVLAKRFAEAMDQPEDIVQKQQQGQQMPGQMPVQGTPGMPGQKGMPAPGQGANINLDDLT